MVGEQDALGEQFVFEGAGCVLVDRVCQKCRILAHRDVLAAQKIAQRGVSTHDSRRRHGQPVRHTVFAPVRKTRDKTGPTPRQHAHRHRAGRSLPQTHCVDKPHTFAYPGHV